MLVDLYVIYHYPLLISQLTSLTVSIVVRASRHPITTTLLTSPAHTTDTMAEDTHYEQLAPDEPLIPASVIDESSQRRLATLLFVLLQAWKVYDILLMMGLTGATDDTEAVIVPMSLFAFMLKYAVIDGLYFWGLRLLNIRGLRMLGIKMVVVLAALFFSSYGAMYSSQIPVVHLVLVPAWHRIIDKRELLLQGDSVSGPVVDMDAHFKGQLTINYLPDLLARFNPWGMGTVCLEPRQTIEVPIEFNTTTTLGSLQIQHVRPDSEVTVTTYQGLKLKKLLRRDYSHLKLHPKYRDIDPIFYVEIPVTSPGIYRLARVFDNHRNAIRTYQAEFVVGACPTAKYIYPFSHTYQCVGSQFKTEDQVELPLVEAVGVAPMTVDVQITSHDKASAFTLDMGPGISRDKPEWLQPRTVTKSTLPPASIDLRKLLAQQLDATVQFQISSITDALNNTLRFNPKYTGSDIWFQYHLRRAPQLRLVDTTPQRQMVTGGSKWLRVEATPAPSENEFPIVVELVHKGRDGTDSFTATTFKLTADLRRGIEITAPGIYSLAGGGNKYCQGEILSPETPVNVTLAPKPEVEIHANPIVDKCLGTIGYNFAFDLSGKPPFTVDYYVYRNQLGRLSSVDANGAPRKLRASGFTETLEFKPTTKGNYVVMFAAIGDSLHKPQEVDRKRYTYGTYFNQVSQAAVAGPRRVALCHGDLATVPVEFSGNGPYLFAYEIINAETKKVLRREKSVAVEGDRYTIDIPGSMVSSLVKLRLIEAFDKFSCKAEITADSVAVQGRSAVAKVGFADSKKELYYTIAEGDSVSVPLKVSDGVSGKDRVGYSLTDDADPPKFIKQLYSSDSRQLVAKQKGIYQLTSFENAGCPGEVSSNTQKIHVDFYPKPDIVVSSPNTEREEANKLTLRGVCQAATQPIKLQLTGMAPFIVDYQVTLPGGVAENRLQRILDDSTSIDLPTENAGDYRLVINKVWDSRYKRGKSKVDTLAVTVEYSVTPLPMISFPTSRLQVCENRIGSIDNLAIPASVTGNYPFLAEALLKHTDGSTEKLKFDVLGPVLELPAESLARSLVLGTHTLEITGLADGHGCKRTEFASPVRFAIEVTPVPDIFKLTPRRHYCVGDHVHYNITGEPPFTVGYTFAGKKQQAMLSSWFSRLATRSGNLTIDTLRDSAAYECPVDLTSNVEKSDQLRLEVHDIPSVKVQRGNDIIEDIHEGEYTELRFSFSGVPPFSLTYVRTTVARSGKRAHVLETFEVDDIDAYDYVVKASLEGTYEAIRIQDKHCVAHRTVGE